MGCHGAKGETILSEIDVSAMRKNTMGNFRRSDAEPNDYYATEPQAVELLLEQEKFSELI